MDSNRVKLYSEFKLPVSARIFSIIFGIVGVAFFSKDISVGLGVGVPLIGGCLLCWGFYIHGYFFKDSRSIYTELSLFGLPVVKKTEQIEINHVSLTRSILRTKILVANKGVPLEVGTSNYQYSVLLIFNNNKKELIHSINDLKEAKEVAYDLASDLDVKIFSAVDHPKKWIDPKTGEETIAKIPRRR